MGDVGFDDVMELVTDVLLKHGELISPVILKPDEFRKRKDSFIETIKTEGVFLYSSTSTP